MVARKKTTTASKTKSRRVAAKRHAKPAVQSALALLRADHQEVSALFDRFERRKEKMTAAQKGALAQEICTALDVHARIEEEIFYPAVRPAIGDEALMDEAEVEHESLKELIAKIEEEGPAGEHFDAHVTVLGEYVKHHVKEEQNEMFKKVRRTDLDLKELGMKLKARKETLMARIEGATARPTIAARDRNERAPAAAQ